MARPLRDPGDLTPVVDRAAGARVVMIGEASHGTHEFYVWRDALTRRLIEEQDFAFVAVEGDWPDCQRVNATLTRGLGDPRAALQAYDRWPTWMWANEETVDFTRWLAGVNASGRRPAGFHGLDVYSMWESLREILVWLREHDPDQVPVALAAYHCFEPYGEDPNAYAWSTQFLRAGCEDAVVRMLIALRDSDFAVRQNAECVAGAEQYYRSLMHGGAQSWNVRERHMDATLARLLDHYGPGAKAVVWAHNTHVGDARATSQGRYDEVTIGQLARERFGADHVLLVGMGSHRGTVVAGAAWGAPTEALPVPPAREDSLEQVLHMQAPPRALFLTPPLRDRPDLLVDELPQRAIGVVYRPDRERWANYAPAVLGDRYDAYLWFDETQALAPLHTYGVDTREPETYPSGV